MEDRDIDALYTLAGSVAYNAHHRPTSPAFTFADRTYTWHQVNGLVNVLCRHLSPYEHVALVMSNSRAHYIAVLACLKMGCVCVPLSPLLNASTLEALALNAQVTLLLHDDGVALPPRFTRRVSTSALEAELDHPTAAMAAKEPHLPRPVTGRDLAHIMFSSGTTGQPKGISISHRARIAYGWVNTALQGFTPDSVTLHSGSLIFNGAYVNLMPHLFNGNHYVLLPAFDAKKFAAAVERYRVTHIVLVPTQIFQLLALPSLKQLQSLRVIISVGAPLPVASKAELQEKLPGRLNEIYGLTEGFSTYLNGVEAVDMAGSVGRAQLYSRMRIARPDGTECAVGEVGEIYGKSPMLFSGYYGLPDKTRATMTDDGWLKTGDLGFVNEQGFLFLSGRHKDMLISGGVNVYPIDIETVASNHPAVQECAVFGVEHPKWGETPVAACLLRAGATISAEELMAWINANVNARHEKISDCVLVREFPRNVAGKILKSDLVKSYKPKAKL